MIFFFTILILLLSFRFAKKLYLSFCFSVTLIRKMGRKRKLKPFALIGSRQRRLRFLEELKKITLQILLIVLTILQLLIPIAHRIQQII